MARVMIDERIIPSTTETVKGLFTQSIELQNSLRNFKQNRRSPALLRPRESTFCLSQLALLADCTNEVEMEEEWKEGRNRAHAHAEYAGSPFAGLHRPRIVQTLKFTWHLSGAKSMLPLLLPSLRDFHTDGFWSFQRPSFSLLSFLSTSVFLSSSSSESLLE